MIDIRNYYAIWKGLLVFVQFLPGCLLFFSYFHAHQRCSSLIAVPLMLLALLLGCGGIAEIQLHTAPLLPAMAYNPPTFAGYCALFLLLTGLFLLLSTGEPLQHLYVLLSIAAFILFAGQIYRVVQPLNPNRTLLVSICYYLIVCTLFRGLLVRLAARLVLPLLHSELPGVHRWAFGLPLSMCILMLLQMTLPTPRDLHEMRSILGVTSLSAAMYLLALRLILNIASDMNSNRRFLLRMKQLEDFYVTLSQSTQQLRSHRHDLRHHLTLLRQMNRDGLSEEIEAYLSRYLSAMPPETAHHYTGNYYIDALIYHFFRLAQAEGIHTYAQISIPSVLRVSPYDLCIIFGNCLENALDACRELSGSARFIRVQGEMIEQKIVLIFSNSFNGHIRMSEHLLSTKPGENHGYGVQSVVCSASHYGGQIKIDYDDRVFRISIILNQPTRQSDHIY